MSLNRRMAFLKHMKYQIIFVWCASHLLYHVMQSIIYDFHQDFKEFVNRNSGDKNRLKVYMFFWISPAEQPVP